MAAVWASSPNTSLTSPTVLDQQSTSLAPSNSFTPSTSLTKPISLSPFCSFSQSSQMSHPTHTHPTHTRGVAHNVGSGIVQSHSQSQITCGLSGPVGVSQSVQSSQSFGGSDCTSHSPPSASTAASHTPTIPTNCQYSSTTGTSLTGMNTTNTSLTSLTGMNTTNTSLTSLTNQLPALTSKAATKDRLYKTTMCAFYAQGKCTRGESCVYAHYDVELRGKPDLFKTQLCRAWQRKGSCERSTHCNFAHGEQELNASRQHQHNRCFNNHSVNPQSPNHSVNPQSPNHSLNPQSPNHPLNPQSPNHSTEVKAQHDNYTHQRGSTKQAIKSSVQTNGVTPSEFNDQTMHSWTQPHFANKHTTQASSCPSNNLAQISVHHPHYPQVAALLASAYSSHLQGGGNNQAHTNTTAINSFASHSPHTHHTLTTHSCLSTVSHHHEGGKGERRSLGAGVGESESPDPPHSPKSPDSPHMHHWDARQLCYPSRKPSKEAKRGEKKKKKQAQSSNNLTHAQSGGQLLNTLTQSVVTTTAEALPHSPHSPHTPHSPHSISQHTDPYSPLPSDGWPNQLTFIGDRSHRTPSHLTSIAHYHSQAHHSSGAQLSLPLSLSQDDRFICDHLNELSARPPHDGEIKEIRQLDQYTTGMRQGEYPDETHRSEEAAAFNGGTTDESPVSCIPFGPNKSMSNSNLSGTASTSVPSPFGTLNITDFLFYPDERSGGDMDFGTVLQQANGSHRGGSHHRLHEADVLRDISVVKPPSHRSADVGSVGVVQRHHTNGPSGGYDQTGGPHTSISGKIESSHNSPRDPQDSNNSRLDASFTRRDSQRGDEYDGDDVRGEGGDSSLDWLSNHRLNTYNNWQDSQRASLSSVDSCAITHLVASARDTCNDFAGLEIPISHSGPNQMDQIPIPTSFEYGDVLHLSPMAEVPGIPMNPHSSSSASTPKDHGAVRSSDCSPLPTTRTGSVQSVGRLSFAHPLDGIRGFKGSADGASREMLQLVGLTGNLGGDNGHNVINKNVDADVIINRSYASGNDDERLENFLLSPHGDDSGGPSPKSHPADDLHKLVHDMCQVQLINLNPNQFGWKNLDGYDVHKTDLASLNYDAGPFDFNTILEEVSGDFKQV